MNNLVICIWDNEYWNEDIEDEWVEPELYVGLSAECFYDTHDGILKIGEKEIDICEISFLQIGRQIVIDEIDAHIGDKVWILQLEIPESGLTGGMSNIVTGMIERTVENWQQVKRLIGNRGRFSIIEGREQIDPWTWTPYDKVIPLIYTHKEFAIEAMDEINSFVESVKKEQKISYSYNTEGIFEGE
jgi:hypothetical protein